MTKSSKLVAIDAQIYIWGVKKQATAGQEVMISKSETFLNYLEENKSRIIIPTPVLTEVTRMNTPEEQEKIFEIIKDSFLVKPFDIMASKICAEMLYKHLTVNDVRELEEAKEDGVTKKKVKYDCLVASIAAASNCSVLYTEDKWLHKFCQGFIKTSPIPPISSQSLLF